MASRPIVQQEARVIYFYDPLRIFGAKLLGNAPAPATAENNKKQACANVAGSPTVANGGVVVAKRMAPKPDQKKVVLKPKPKKVIDIKASPNKKEVLQDKKKEGDSNFKKKSHHTLTLVFTTRSKATWGITNKLKERIIDIDSDDVDDELVVVEFKNVPKRELQLVDISALLMATKAYTHEQILVMEKIILAKLEWTLTMPTPLVFLLRFIKASVPDQEVNELVRLTDYTHEQLENMAHFLSELGMMHYATIKYFPSMVAASAVFAARCTLNKAPLWNETLKLHSGYSQEQLMHVNMNWDCARLLVSFHSTVGNREEKVVYLKYSDPEKGVVAMLPPAKNLLPEGSNSQ
ncbi:hypothetical protein JHK87_053371 [Glycine soja]|nr:hypothetical protein JHK87_053371 [Glycine soja]